jgi:hypothetical protein
MISSKMKFKDDLYSKDDSELRGPSFYAKRTSLEPLE